MSALPDIAPGHWESADGAAMARQTLEHFPTRVLLPYGHETDLALANRMFMAGRNDLDLGALQDAAKQRIRWLSANLARALALLHTAHGVIAEPSDDVEGSEEWFAEVEALFKINPQEKADGKVDP